MRRRVARFLCSSFSFIGLLVFFVVRSGNKLGEVHRVRLSHFKPEDEYYFGLNLKPNVKLEGDICPLPEIVRYGQPWPKCLEKLNWMSQYWSEDPCYAAQGVDGSVCSVLKYLQEKEDSCPPDGAVSKQTKPVLSETISGPRLNFSQLYKDLSKFSDFEWIKQRIESMESLWMHSAAKLFSEKFKKKTFQKKSIHLHLGLMELGMGKEAKGGGALGELVQWSDLIASLYTLGHEIVITRSKRELVYIYTEYIFSVSKSLCSMPPSPDLFKFDIIYTDITGFKEMSKLLPKFETIQCRFKILDSFGTEAHFNVDSTDEGNPYGGLKLKLGQFNTMYPHTPDNTFLGFVVESNELQRKATSESKRDIALVYGKDGTYWKGSKKYLEIVKEYVSEVHGTVAGNLDHVPDFVLNHGVLSLTDLHGLLRRTKVFIGLGFPFEGPAPLEAIAAGAVFLNPMFKEPINGNNHEFFRNKPTDRRLRSQNPYAGEYILEPRVYNVDITNESDVHGALNKITRTGNVRPHLPYEFSSEGMLERLAFQTEKQDFCSRPTYSGPFKDPDPWPPVSSLKIISAGKSCKDACHENGLICEPLFFPLLNTKSAFEDAGFKCNFLHHPHVPKTVYPAYFETEKACCIQTHNLFFSCADSMTGFIRLCPCRDFIPGQVALCKDCV